MKKQAILRKASLALLMLAAMAMAFAIMAPRAIADEAAAEPEVVSGTVTTTIDMSGYDEGAVVRVWVPVAHDGQYQTVTDAAVDAPTATTAEMTTDAWGNNMAYIEWGADVAAADRVATVSFHAERTEALVRDMVDDGSEIPADIAEKYLVSDKWVAADDPEVKALSDEICAGKETTLDKARAIYDWIYDNMNRNNDVFHCGDGDVCRLIKEDEREGKCTDINSTFVALCRAQGIPANEVFGIRMNDADITGNQHCWAEFYLPGTGWVPVDPADVLKAVLNDELAKDSEEALAKKDYYWGAWDAKRVEYSEGRELTLEPAQEAGPLNNFGYPYAEVNGEPRDQCSAEEFVYTVSFEADNAEPAEDAAASAEPATLEEYFAAHPDEYTEVENAFQEGFGGEVDSDFPATATLNIAGNEIQCTVNIDMEFTQEQIDAVRAEMENQFDLYVDTMSGLIQDLEDGSGYSPITVTLSYFDMYGNNLGTRTFSK